MSGQVTFMESMTGFVQPCPRVLPPPPWHDDPEVFDKTVRHAASSAAGPASALELIDLTLRVRPEPGPDDGLAGIALSGVLRWDNREYRITGGDFVALAATPTSGRRLRYRLMAEADDFPQLLLAGVKTVTGRPTRWWRDTTHMSTLILTKPNHPHAGTLHLSLEAFARQLATFTGGLAPITAFLRHFTHRLLHPSTPHQTPR